MNSLVIVLRLIHILSGAFWVGSNILFVYFISPTVAATGESGQKFIAYLMTRSKVHLIIIGSAILTVLAGGSLYWIDSGGFKSGWFGSPASWGFGIGGILALVGLVFGILVGKNSNQLGQLAAQIQGKPTPEQMAKIQAAQRQLKFQSPISSIVLILALACMATARYWRF